MRKQYRVAFVTGSRADYGIVRNYLRLLDGDDSIGLDILVTGALLSAEYGHQVELIYKDGFHVAAEIDIELNSADNASVIHSMAIALDRFGAFFKDNRYDLIIILGDRFEVFSAAIAAAMNHMPILHIHGGEATFGNYDEFIRHSITKMSTYHITATEEYKKRVIQLGESPDRVFRLGALGAENCKNIKEDDVPEIVREFLGREYFVVLFHPETLTDASTSEQIEELLSAIECEHETEFVFLGSNADTHSDVIRKMEKQFIGTHDNTYYIENLSTCGYHYLLKNSRGLIGNSSSGLIEAPSLGVYTINIGERQAGRVRGESVYDVSCKKADICAAINSIKSKEKTGTILNPYFMADAAEKYFEATLEILRRLEENGNMPKVFYDL